MPPPSVPLIVVCVGTEAWLRDEAIRACADQCLAAGAASLDAVSFTADGLDPQAVLEAARTPPLASPRRLVVVRGPLEPRDDAFGWLIRYAHAPNPSTCLVVEFAAPPTGALRAALRPVARDVPCHPLTGGALAAWIRHRMQRAGAKTLTPEGAQALVARVGHDLSALAQMVEQLALYVGPRAQVTAQDVVALVGWSVEERVFAVVDAAIAQDRATALRVTRRLLEESGVTPEELLGALGKHLRRLWQAVRLVERGTSPPEAAQAVGVPWHAQAPHLRLLARTSSSAVAATLEALVETDRLLKTGANGTDLLEPCVWELARGPGRELRGARGGPPLAIRGGGSSGRNPRFRPGSERSERLAGGRRQAALAAR